MWLWSAGVPAVQRIPVFLGLTVISIPGFSFCGNPPGPGQFTQWLCSSHSDWQPHRPGVMCGRQLHLSCCMLGLNLHTALQTPEWDSSQASQSLLHSLPSCSYLIPWWHFMHLSLYKKSWSPVDHPGIASGVDFNELCLKSRARQLWEGHLEPSLQRHLLLSCDKSHFSGHGDITFGTFDLTRNGPCHHSQLALNHGLVRPERSWMMDKTF